MEFEIYGGKLRYWVMPCCLMYKNITNNQRKEVHHTVSIEILRWYVALTITLSN